MNIDYKFNSWLSLCMNLFWILLLLWDQIICLLRWLEYAFFSNDWCYKNKHLSFISESYCWKDVINFKLDFDGVYENDFIFLRLQRAIELICSWDKLWWICRFYFDSINNKENSINKNILIYWSSVAGINFGILTHNIIRYIWWSLQIMYYGKFDSYTYSRPVSYRSYYPRIEKKEILNLKDPEADQVKNYLRSNGYEVTDLGGLARGIRFGDIEVGRRNFNHHNDGIQNEFYIRQWKETNDLGPWHATGRHYVITSFEKLMNELDKVVTTQKKKYRWEVVYPDICLNKILWLMKNYWWAKPNNFIIEWYQIKVNWWISISNQMWMNEYLVKNDSNQML